MAQPGNENEDAYFAITQFTSWINSADTKAGFLSAALAIVTTATLSSAPADYTGFGRFGVRTWLGMGVLSASAVCTLCSTVCLLLTVYPRVRPQRFSRYSWPDVAARAESDLIALNQQTDRDEAWATAKSLAEIAREKFRFLRLAFSLWIAATGLLLVSAIVR